MTLRMSRSVVVDGIEHFIIAEGGSGKECLSIIAAIAEEIGAAPMAAPTSTTKGRGRPPKPAAAPPVEPKAPTPAAAPPEAGSVFGPPAQRTLIDEIREAEAADPGGTHTVTQDVVWSDEPPVPVDEHSVELEAPPSFDEPPSPEPPPPSEEDELRTHFAAAYDGLRGRVPATWHQACATAYQKAITDNGGDMLAMTVEQLKKAIMAFGAYAAKCDEALKGKR